MVFASSNINDVRMTKMLPPATVLVVTLMKVPTAKEFEIQYPLRK